MADKNTYNSENRITRSCAIASDSNASKDYYDSIAGEFDEMDQYWANPYDTATWNLRIA